MRRCKFLRVTSTNDNLFYCCARRAHVSSRFIQPTRNSACIVHIMLRGDPAGCCRGGRAPPPIAQCRAGGAPLFF